MKEQTIDFPYGRLTHLLTKGWAVIRNRVHGATLCGIALDSRRSAFTGQYTPTCKICLRKLKEEQP